MLYEEYLEKRKAVETEEKTEQTAPKVNEYRLRKEKAAELRKCKNALARLENENQENDDKIRALSEELQNPEIASDYEKAIVLSAQLDELNSRNEEILLEWAELSQKIEEMEKAT